MSDDATPWHAWGGMRSQLLWVYEGPVPDTAKSVITDRRDAYWTWLLLEGAVKVSTPQGAWRAKAGDWMVCPHEIGRQNFSSDARILSIHFSAQWPSGENLFTGSAGNVFPSARYPRLARSARSLARIARARFPGVTQHLLMQRTDFRTFWRMQMNFARWMLDFSEAMQAEGRRFFQAGVSDPRVIRAANCLHETPLHEPFPEERLLAETGLGRARLEQLFWERFGLHTRDYWNRLRLRSAMHDLATGARSVKEVCHRHGFRQASHFTKWFRLHAGRGPLAYRRSITERRAKGTL